MYTFSLFRIQLRTINSIEPMFPIDKKTMIQDLILKKPNGEVRKNNFWTVDSDITEFNDKSLYFKFGRVSNKEKVKFDREEYRFVETEGEEAEYTDCIYYFEKQVLAIGKKSGIHIKPITVAKYLCSLINRLISHGSFPQESLPTIKLSTCTVNQIKNPIKFIEMISNSYKIIKYSIEIYPPNPPEFKSLIHEPIEKLINESNSEKSTLTLDSKKRGLNPKALEETTRAASQLGDNVFTKLYKNSSDTKPTTISLNQTSEDLSVEIDTDRSMPNRHNIYNRVKTFIDHFFSRKENEISHK